MKKEERMQRIARYYLYKIKHIARKYGLEEKVKEVIRANKDGTCKATKVEIEMLARICNDERIRRNDVPKLIGKSYRHCNDKGIFDKIKVLKPLGRLSKVDVLIIKEELDNG